MLTEQQSDFVAQHVKLIGTAIGTFARGHITTHGYDAVYDRLLDALMAASVTYDPALGRPATHVFNKMRWYLRKLRAESPLLPLSLDAVAREAAEPCDTDFETLIAACPAAEHREVLRLTFVEGLSLREVAERQGCSVSRVRLVMKRALHYVEEGLC